MRRPGCGTGRRGDAAAGADVALGAAGHPHEHRQDRGQAVDGRAAVRVGQRHLGATGTGGGPAPGIGGRGQGGRGRERPGPGGERGLDRGVAVAQVGQAAVDVGGAEAVAGAVLADREAVADLRPGAAAQAGVADQARGQVLEA